MVNEEAHDLLDWLSEFITILERLVVSPVQSLPWYPLQKDIDRFKRLRTICAKGLK